MKKIFTLFCILLMLFQTVSAENSAPDGGESSENEYAFFDDMADFSKIYSRSDNVVFDVIPEDQYELFYGDYTIMQRTTLDSAYITYCVPYWHTAEIEVYHYNYDTDEFTFFVSEDNENYISAEAQPVEENEINGGEGSEDAEKEEKKPVPEEPENNADAETGGDDGGEAEENKNGGTEAGGIGGAEQAPVLISEAGSAAKWQKKVYKIENEGLTNKYFKIVWADINGSGHPNWGQAIGSVKVKTAEKTPCSGVIHGEDFLIIPDEGTCGYTLGASVYDQMGEEMQCEPEWKFLNLPEGAATEGSRIQIEATVPENTEITAEIYAEEKMLASKKIRLVKLKAGDVNGDAKIDEDDLSLICEAFMCKGGSEAYGEAARGDIDKNGIIDIADISYIAKNIEK